MKYIPFKIGDRIVVTDGKPADESAWMGLEKGTVTAIMDEYPVHGEYLLEVTWDGGEETRENPKHGQIALVTWE